MFAINHAATALILKKKFPAVKMFFLLISVQLIELFWVAFNLIGIEKTKTDTTVNSVANIHLYHMPFSHSVLMTIGVALLSYLVIRFVFKKNILALAVSIGIVSHIILDLLTHVADIPLTPFAGSEKYGIGFYAVPLIGFIVETVYGIICWFIYKGNWKLLATILFFNISNISFFVASISGPETLLAGKPMLIVSIILVQILVTLYLVGRYGKQTNQSKNGYLQFALSKLNIF